MPEKTIYFHIGTHKTGTTALQKFFMENRKILEKSNYIYDFYNQIEMNHGHLIRPAMWENMELDRSKNYILSGEDFYQNILNIDGAVNQKLSGFKINFIIYLKRQDLMKQSVYNQIVKMHGYHKPIGEDNHYRLNYYIFLKKLNKIYPTASVSVRVYENEQFTGGSIYSDFLNILGLRLTDEYHIVKSVINPSLTRDKLEFSRYINMLGLSDSSRVEINKLVVQSVLDANETELFRDQGILSPFESQVILNKYSESNKKIAQEFLKRSNGKLFYNSLPDSNTAWQDYQGLSKNVATKILKVISRMNREAVVNLYDEVMLSNSDSPEFVKSANFLIPIISIVLKKDKPYHVNAIANFSRDDTDHLIAANVFGKIAEKLNQKSKPADILREVAYAFENVGEIEVAEKIMKRACLLRPNGPVIKKKLEEYQKKIQTTSSK